jgi:type II secretory pathway component PulM
MGAVRPSTPAASSPHLLQRWRGAISRLSPLAREITLALVLKLLLLGLIWWAFFSEPAARHMRLDPDRVQQQLLQSTSITDAPHAKR